jgi:RND superfamily putative drug exporter
MVAPRRVVAAAILVMVGCAIFGVPVAKSLSGGGIRDPDGQSARAAAVLADTFDRPDMQFLLVVSSDKGVRDGQAKAVGTEIVEQLKQTPGVAFVDSPWTVMPAAANALISKDGSSALIAAGLIGDESETAKAAADLSDRLEHDRDGVSVQAGGAAAVNAQINEQTERDLLLMESIAIPLSFVVLVWTFGGLLAATLPLTVGAMSILSAMTVLRLMTFVTDVSIFALNLAIAMGLALAIDYTLLILSRYRDELGEGRPPDEALVRTMATAGRTVVFSAIIVGLAMLPMALFPMNFLKSFAYAGVATVAFSMCAALILTPAAITLLGDHLGSLDVRRLVRCLRHRGRPVRPPVDQSFWYRTTIMVIRRAAPLALAVVTLLTLLGAPFLGARWGFPDDRVLPVTSPAHLVGDDIRTNFATDAAAATTVVASDTANITPAEVSRYAADLSLVSEVPWVSAPDGTYVAGRQTGPPSGPTGSADGRAFFTVAGDAPLGSEASERQLDRLHKVAPPNGAVVQFAGAAQSNRDIVDAVIDGLPAALGVIAVTTFIMLFLLTGSVVLPVKAVVLNLLSLTAAFGALVWIFQDGHFGGFGTTVTGTVGITMPVLLFCIAFGLSMDYEVFLLSRIREFWLASGQTCADNDEAIAQGLAHTARVVTAAALIMSISFAALVAAQVSFMRMLGVGLTLAVLMDATLVRMVLLPAFMHLMGRANWWAPGPLARLHQRIGISESPSPGLSTAENQDVVDVGPSEESDAREDAERVADLDSPSR